MWLRRGPGVCVWGVASGPGHSGCELGGTCRCCGVPAAPGRGAQAAGSSQVLLSGRFTSEGKETLELSAL